MMNKFIIQGRLATVPEIKKYGETQCLRMLLAIRRNFAKEGSKDTDFINVTAFGKTAEFISKHFAKGQMILLCGRLSQDEYEKDGKKISSVSLIADECEFCDTPKPYKKDSKQDDDDGLPF